MRSFAPTLVAFALTAPLAIAGVSWPAFAGQGEPLVRVQFERGAFDRIDEIPLERYVAGVVAAEVPSGWPAASLRAQAVASRTYALHRMAAARARSARYDVEAATTGQVFSEERVPANVREAVRATKGQVLLYAGRPLLAAFHSASGGRTASSDEVWGESHPYLVSVPVPDEDDAPATYWRTPVSRPTMRRALEAYGLEVGRIRDVRVVRRSQSGRAVQVRVTGDRASALLSGRELRDALGETRIKSTLFDVRSSLPAPAARSTTDSSGGAKVPDVGAGPDGGQEGDFVIVGTGYGHGVGLSQWAARAMAERGRDHPEILLSFYRGARLARLGPADLSALARGESQPHAGGDEG